MPAKDIYHDIVKQALINDGWTITHDPLTLRLGKSDTFVDLGAQQLIGAEKQAVKIAVEIKSFLGASRTYDLEQALGQYTLYTLYKQVLEIVQPDRTLYIATHEGAFVRVFESDFGSLLLKNRSIQVMIFDQQVLEIKRWIPNRPIVQS